MVSVKSSQYQPSLHLLKHRPYGQELDQLVTTKQDVVYNFFNLPTYIDSKLIVIVVANTMDLPERVVTGRV